MVRILLLISIAIAVDLPAFAQTTKGLEETFKPNTEKINIVNGAMRPWSALKRWLIEYDCTERPVPTNNWHVRMTMAVGLPGNFYKSKAHGTLDCPWQSDPFREEFFLNGNIACLNWPFSRLFSEYSIKPGDMVDAGIGLDILWRVIPSCPLTLYRMPDLDIPQTSAILGRALLSPDCRLLAGSEEIDDENCLVFIYTNAYASKKTWVATRLGLCLMKEETRYIHSNELIQRILTAENGEVSPGLWMPIDYRVQWFHGGTNEGIPQRETRVRILHCQVNDDVPQSIFEHTISAGSIKDDGAYHFTQVSPGGEDLLLNFVGFMTEYAHLPTGDYLSVKSYLWPLIGLICGIGLGLIVFPQRRKAAAVLANKTSG